MITTKTKIKKIALTVYFQIGVNVIGLPNFHRMHLSDVWGTPRVEQSKFF